MSRRTSRAKAQPQQEPTPEVEENQTAPVAEEDVSQDVPEGVDPATGEILVPEEAGQEAPVDPETGKELVLPEGLTLAPGVEATQETVDEVAADVARMLAEGGHDDPAPEDAAPKEDAPAAEAPADPEESGGAPEEPAAEHAPEEVPAAEAGEPEPEPKPEPKPLTLAQQRQAKRDANKRRGNVVKLEPKAAEPAPEEPEEPTEKPEEAAEKKPKKTRVTRRTPESLPVLKDGWPVDTGREVVAQCRPEGVAMPTGKANWTRAGEMHYVYILSEAVHGTYWIDVSFDRKLRNAELWWIDAESGNAHRHTMWEVSSDEDVMKALGFTVTFPASQDEVALPEGIATWDDLWRHATGKLTVSA